MGRYHIPLDKPRPKLCKDCVYFTSGNNQVVVCEKSHSDLSKYEVGAPSEPKRRRRKKRQ